MSVENVNGSYQISGIENTSGTADVITTLHSEVIAELDQQIKDFNKDLEVTTEQKQEIRETKYDYNAAAATGVETVNAQNQACINITPEQFNVMNEIAIELGAQTSIPKNVVTLEGGTVYQITAEDFEAFCNAVNEKADGKLDDLNSMSELKMIKFQSLMDSRKQAMAMLTNSMQSQSQMNQQIIGNMKA